MRRMVASGVARGLILGLAVFSLCLLGGCNNGPTSTMEQLGQDANTWGFGRRFPQNPSTDEFTFGVGDEVDIVCEDEPRLQNRHVVRADGKINLFLLNDVSVAGLTPNQVREKLISRIGMFLRAPEKLQVSVGVIQSKRYFVVSTDPQLGGTIIRSTPLQGDTLLLDVFATMPSVTALNDDCHVKVIRGDPYQPRVLTINVREIYMLGRTGGNVRIQPDDIIYVPPTLLGHIHGFLTAVTLPFQGLFRAAQTAAQVDTTLRILQGQNVGNNFNRRRVF